MVKGAPDKEDPDMASRNRAPIDIVSRIPLPFLATASIIVIVVFVLFVALIIFSYVRNEAIDIAGLRFGKSINDQPITQAILITDRECSDLGDGWIPHSELRGRFPIGAGQGTDINGVVMAFVVGQEDKNGEYVHTLTVDEMPKHRHSQDGSTRHPRRCSGDCGSLVPQRQKQTGTRGGDMPHNNIPPFFVVNFCKMDFGKKD